MCQYLQPIFIDGVQTNPEKERGVSRLRTAREAGEGHVLPEQPPRARSPRCHVFSDSRPSNFVGPAHYHHAVRKALRRERPPPAPPPDSLQGLHSASTPRPQQPEGSLPAARVLRARTTDAMFAVQSLPVSISAPSPAKADLLPGLA